MKTRDELRQIAKENNVRRGRNKSDTIRNLEAAGIDWRHYCTVPFEPFKDITVELTAVTPTYFRPQLMVNKRGEIILVTNKTNNLSHGILVGYTHDSTSNKSIPLGKFYTDWEVAGELKPYTGTVHMFIKNKS
jgi:hypothetical protein